MKTLLIHITLFFSLCSYGQNLPFYRLVKLTGPNGEAHTNLPNPLNGITSTPYTPDTTGSGGGIVGGGTGGGISVGSNSALTYSPIPVATGTHYFVNNLYTGSPQNGGINTPFVSMSQVQSAINNGTIRGGDEVHFLRGQSYPMKADFSNFNFTSYLIIGTYGSGSDPIFKYDIANNGSVATLNRNIIYASTASHILLDSIHFTDPTMSETDHNATATTGYGLVVSAGNNIFLNHCTFDKLGVDVSMGASNSVVTDCSFTNGRMVRNDSAPDNDYGANGVLVEADNVTVWHCTLKDLWAVSIDYGYDGGAVEEFGSHSNMRVLYNTVINCNGFQEFGASDGGTSNNHLIAYNLLINNGKLAYVNNSGQFSVHVNNYQFFNNVVVETIMQRTNESALFGQALSTTTANILNLRNNIFYATDGVNMISASLNSSGQVTHENNAYRMASGNTIFTVHTSENLLGLVTVFTSEAGDPSTWSYNLPAGSGLIDKGAALSVVGSYPSFDYFGNNNLSGAYPDMGIAEYQYQ